MVMAAKDLKLSGGLWRGMGDGGGQMPEPDAVSH